MFTLHPHCYCLCSCLEHHSLNLIVSCYFLINPPLASRVVIRILKIYLDTSKHLAGDDAGEFEDLLNGEGLTLYANKTEVDSYTEKMYGAL